MHRSSSRCLPSTQVVVHHPKGTHSCQRSGEISTTRYAPFSDQSNKSKSRQASLPLTYSRLIFNARNGGIRTRGTRWHNAGALDEPSTSAACRQLRCLSRGVHGTLGGSAAACTMLRPCAVLLIAVAVRDVLLLCASFHWWCLVFHLIGVFTAAFASWWCVYC